jgi:uncharacterized protein (DUF58 family)
MKLLSNPAVSVSIKIYICIALVAGAVLSDPVTAVAALIALLLFLLMQWRPINSLTGLLTGYFAFFTLTVLWESPVNFIISNTISLPALVLITQGMLAVRVAPVKKSGSYSRTLTRIAVTTLVIDVTMLGVSLALDSSALLIASVLALVFLGMFGGLSLRAPAMPLEVSPVQLRVLAGSRADVQVVLKERVRSGGSLYLFSPYEWLRIHKPSMALTGDRITLEMTVSPPLSGPSGIEIKALLLDRWGLVQTGFNLDVLRLHVIPRARYASWLAKLYLDATKRGVLPLVSNVSTVRPQYGMRQGIEYYGSQSYQPGDNLRSIDWKHSAKYNKLITKEFIETHGQPAMLLVNLAVSSADEADRLAQKTITTAISLAQEQIPTVIAAYDHRDVRFVTPVLQMQQIVVRALEITKEIVVFDNPARYLFAPDISRLRANITRLKFVEDSTTRTLSELLGVEYKNLLDGVTRNPATQALYRSIDRGNAESTIVIISELNHDANAIAVNKFVMENRGYAVVPL